MTVEELEIVIRAKVSDAIKGIEQVKEKVKEAVRESIAPMQEIANKTKQIYNASKTTVNNTANYMNNLRSNMKSATAQAELLRFKMDSLTNLINKANRIDASGTARVTTKLRLELEAELERLTNQYNKLGTEAQKTSDKTSKGFERGLKSLRRFALSLFSIRGIWALLSRAAQSYLATDDKLRASTELTSNALGQTLAPVIKLVTDLAQYAVIAFGLLYKMFTGIDILSKVTTKNMNKLAKSTKKVKDELLAVDEITNLNDDSTGLGSLTNLQADIDALDDFNKKVEEVQKLFDNWNVQGLVDNLKSLAQWLWDNRDAVVAVTAVLGTLFIGSKITSIIGGVAKLIGVGGTAGVGATGLAGLGTTLAWIAGFAIIGIEIAIIVKGISDAIKTLQTLKDIEKYNQNIDKDKYELEKKMVNEGYNVPDWVKQEIKDYEAKGKTASSVYGVLDNALTKVSNLITNPAKYGLDLFKSIKVGQWATGNVLTKPTFGIGGEYAGAISNPEIVSPQNIMRDTVKQALAEILPYMNNGNNNGDTILNVNGYELARVTYKDFQNIDRSMGTSTKIRRVS